MMKIFCSWCGAAMGEKPGPAGTTTHSLCPRCSATLHADLDARSAA
jgi:ribosomal protein S27AE